MMKDENIDQLFRDKLQDFEQMPPAYLLDRVLSAAAGSKRKKRLIIWRMTGVAAALLIAFVAGWQINELNSSKELQRVAETGSIASTVKTVPENGVGENIDSVKVSEKPSLMMAIAAQTNQTQKNVVKEKSHSSERMPMNVNAVRLPESDRESVALLKSRNFKSVQTNEEPVTLKLEKNRENPGELGLLSIDEQIIRQNQQSVMTVKSASEKNRWLIGAQVSPVYNVSHSSHSQVYADNMLNSSSGNPVELGGGLTVAVKTGKRLSIQSGIYYSALEQSSGNSANNLRNDNLYAGTNNGSAYFNTNVNIDASTNKMLMNSTAGIIEFNGVPNGMEIGTNLEDKSLASAVVVSDARFIQNFEYIEIPLYLRYSILDARFGIEMMGGFSSNVLVSNQTFMESSAGNDLIGKTKDMESVAYSGSLGLGLKYSLSKRFYLNVEPRIKYYLNSLNSNNSVSYKPYTIGVYTGLSYQF